MGALRTPLSRSPLFAENGRFAPDRLPIEEVIKPGPGMDLGIADLAVETAGMLVRMLLPGRTIIHPAIGTGEFFSRPDAVGHARYPLPAVLFSVRPDHLPKDPFEDLNRNATKWLMEGFLHRSLEPMTK